MDINTVDGAVMKTYIYADSQILAQHDGNSSDPRYFYLHDRLGSVREIIDTDGDVVNSYTYNPFGEMFPTECNETVTNPFKFTGQWFDSEIEQYYLRARQYDPALMRFTGRDPEKGKYQEPMTLHRYLYCTNNPINFIDPTGRYGTLGEQLVTTSITSMLNGTITGFANMLRGGKFWSMQGFGSGAIGGAAGCVTGFFGYSGLVASAVSGSVTSGLASYAEKKDFETALAHAAGGAIMGYALGNFADYIVDLTPELWCFDMETFVEATLGVIGGEATYWGNRLFIDWNTKRKQNRE